MSLTGVVKEAGFRALGSVLQAGSSGRGLVSGLDAIALRGRPIPRVTRNRIPRFQILVYHRVLPDNDPFAMSPVSVSAFDRQMALLGSRFRVVSLDQLTDELDAESLKPGTVCVTFDDGYRDNHDHAMPVLLKYGIPATIFLATGLIGTGESSWYDKVLAILRETRAGSLDFAPAGLRSADLARPETRSALAHRLLEWLKGFAPAERDDHIRDLGKSLGCGPEAASKAMLDWDLVRAMHAKGIAFGAHTVNHPILAKVGEAEMDAEIGASKAAIEKELQRETRHFAYPNGRRGDYNADTIRLLKKHRFSLALTTNPGVNGPEQDRFQLLRRQPWEDSVDSLFSRMLMERLTT
ncbi:MAG TPA: polysaccharide deacetylase family protein [Fibrobacteria bacterium]|nr:polysaccharide deacetylase family protein [Fibrobacteria bacterium]